MPSTRTSSGWTRSSPRSSLPPSAGRPRRRPLRHPGSRPCPAHRRPRRPGGPRQARPSSCSPRPGRPAVGSAHPRRAPERPARPPRPAADQPDARQQPYPGNGRRTGRSKTRHGRVQRPARGGAPGGKPRRRLSVPHPFTVSRCRPVRRSFSGPAPYRQPILRRRGREPPRTDGAHGPRQREGRTHLPPYVRRTPAGHSRSGRQERQGGAWQAQAFWHADGTQGEGDIMTGRTGHYDIGPGLGLR
jgi:hypothetical protein